MNKPVSDKNIIDYDIHGIVGVRVINPTVSDAAAVANQLGQFQKSFKREPDIIIRFKEKLSTPSLIYLGLDCAGFTDEGFYIFSSKENAKVRIPFEQIGSQFEILCESGLRSLPWLFEMINLVFLSKNYIPLHASAFVYNGVGVVVTGWTKGGKTEALLSFANHGAHYVGDEWVILSADGKEMFGIPVPICVWEWYFKDIPALLPKIGVQRKILFKGIHFLDAIHRALGSGSLKKSFPAKILGQALPTLKRQLNVRLLPEIVFRDRFCESAVPDKLILSLSYNATEISVEVCDSFEIARRMTSSNLSELMPFLEFYKAFKFAFPNHRNEFLENIEQRQYSLLCSAFADMEAYKVFHPYPVSFEDYFNRLKPLFEKTTKGVLEEEPV
ncbi:MAG: hypothetical protein O6943_03510 [Bacteroidetes bacterium]|nr:hypothetical protein [Bacteroidota bacterium]